MTEVFPRSSRTSGGPADPGEEDDRVARANGRVKTEWAVKHHDYRDGQNKVGIWTTLGSDAAESRLKISQPRGMKSKVGPKICFEIQNVVGISGRKGKPNDSLRMGSNKERHGPYLEGDSAHASGQIQGGFAGPSHVIIGEQSVRPTEMYYPTIMRADCKGRIG